MPNGGMWGGWDMSVIRQKGKSCEVTHTQSLQRNCVPIRCWEFWCYFVFSKLPLSGKLLNGGTCVPLRCGEFRCYFLLFQASATHEETAEKRPEKSKEDCEVGEGILSSQCREEVTHSQSLQKHCALT